MANNFDDYIKQLQGLENSENTASLKAIKDLHGGVLSYFPKVIAGVNSILSSGSVPEKVVQEIEKSIPELSRCKSAHLQLLSCERSQLYRGEIQRLLDAKDSKTLSDVTPYCEAILGMISKNEQQLRSEKESATLNTPKPLESRLLSGEKLSWQQRCEIASSTRNVSIIQKLKNDSSQKVINALLANPNVSDDVKLFISQREATRVEPSYTYTPAQDFQSEQETGGLGKFILIFLIIVSIVTLIGLIL